MRNLLNITAPLFENTLPATVDELESMKSVIAAKIKELPTDDATAKTLREIEELLSHISSGGRMGAIGTELHNINDPTVIAAQKMLTRYIAGIDMTPDQRKQLFTLWREDKLVDRKKLLQVGKKTLADVISNYSDNSGIKEFVDDLMRIQALGQGKGEFAFCVLSKSISKPSKGDLVVDGRKVEVKTTEGGAGRFTDNDVRPGAGFEEAARAMTTYINENPELSAIDVPVTGVNLILASQIATQLTDNKEFVELCKKLINIIFDNTDNSAVNKIVDSIASGNTSAALQEYSKLSFNYYIDKKDDEGVLYINLSKDPVRLVWFTNADELSASGLRLHAKTIYLNNLKDLRYPYPQMDIVDTKAGGDVSPARSIRNSVAATKQVATAQKIQDVAQRTPTSELRPQGAKDLRAELGIAESIRREKRG